MPLSRIIGIESAADRLGVDIPAILVDL